MALSKSFLPLLFIVLKGYFILLFSSMYVYVGFTHEWGACRGEKRTMDLIYGAEVAGSCEQSNTVFLTVEPSFLPFFKFLRQHLFVN